MAASSSAGTEWLARSYRNSAYSVTMCTTSPALYAGIAQLISTRVRQGGWHMQHRDGWADDRVRAHFVESADVMRQTSERCAGAVLAAAQAVADTFRSGGKVMLCGNGGSAADCQHVAAEFVSRLTSAFERPGLPAIALTTDTSFLTAFANDCGFDGIFARQIQALGKAGDLLIGISTSGNSSNVIEAVTLARRMSIHTIGLTGAGGRLTEMVDLNIAVPSTSTQYVQEAHLVIEHILCDLVERHLFGAAGPGETEFSQQSAELQASSMATSSSV